MSERLPFELEVEGRAMIPHMAERAKINIHIANSGNDKATVSREVLASVRELEVLLKDLSPKIDTPEAQEAAPLAYWSKTSLSATSRVQYDKDGQPLPDREYTSSINFDIRFRDFKALGAFGATAAKLPHVEVQNINWILTTTTEDLFRSQLRRKAAKDAMDKAQDYCEVLGCSKIRPIELREGSGSAFASTTHFPRRNQLRHASMNPPVAARMMAGPAQQGGSLFGNSMSVASAPPPQPEPEIIEDFEFKAQEIRMDWVVWVKFQADPPAY